MPIEYQSFSAFLGVIQPLVAPEDLGEELEALFREQVGNALCDLETMIPWLRTFNLRFYTKESVNEFCNASTMEGPVGKITQLFAYKSGTDCKKLYYKKVSPAALDCWLERQRCLCPATTPPSGEIYDSPYCNYVIAGDAACTVPYLTGEEDDCRFKSLDDDDRIFSVGPDYKVYAAPRFPCGYTLLMQWQGIHRKWNDSDLVPVDQQVREAVINYVEAKMARKEREFQAKEEYERDYAVNLRTLKFRFHDEQDTEMKRDCSSAIDQLVSTFKPLYETPIYSP